MSVLVELDLHDAAEACRRLVRESEFLPAVAAIVQRTAVVRRERIAALPEPEPEHGPTCTPEEAAEYLRRIKQNLAGIGRPDTEGGTP